MTDAEGADPSGKPARGWLWVGLGLPALLGVALLCAHLLGWREHTSILSGTFPGSREAVAQGLTYVLAWFAFVVLAPIAALSAGVYVLLSRWLFRERPVSAEGNAPPVPHS